MGQWVESFWGTGELWAPGWESQGSGMVWVGGGGGRREGGRQGLGSRDDLRWVGGGLRVCPNPSGTFLPFIAELSHNTLPPPEDS